MVAVLSYVYSGRNYVDGSWIDYTDDTIVKFQFDKGVGTAKTAITEKTMTI